MRGTSQLIVTMLINSILVAGIRVEIFVNVPSVGM
jgi:hypothetical protein